MFMVAVGTIKRGRGLNVGNFCLVERSASSCGEDLKHPKELTEWVL